MTLKNRMKKDDAAQVGIGTMIVFIATILVAAVAAGVLIDTSQKLQAKSTSTGDAATDDVGTSLSVIGASGARTLTNEPLEQLDILVALSPGAADVDLQTVIIQLNDGQNLRVADFEDATNPTALTKFVVSFIRDDDNSGSNFVMTPGDLVQIRLGDTGTAVDLALGNNVNVEVNMLPTNGHEVTIEFTTPPTYGNDTEVDLF